MTTNCWLRRGRCARSNDHVSPAMLQRRMQIGYTRAMQLLEMLEEEGVVAAGDPGKSRQVVKAG